MNSECDVEILLSACVLCKLFSVSYVSLNCHWISDVYKNAQHFGSFRHAVETTVQHLTRRILKKCNCINFVLFS
jgi:hypothetical protein